MRAAIYNVPEVKFTCVHHHYRTTSEDSVSFHSLRLVHVIRVYTQWVTSRGNGMIQLMCLLCNYGTQLFRIRVIASACWSMPMRNNAMFYCCKGESHEMYTKYNAIIWFSRNSKMRKPRQFRIISFLCCSLPLNLAKKATRFTFAWI